MIFVKTKDLKAGMRIARPIYNRKGVLLYERDFRLNEQSITSIVNFGLMGIFVLEPSEPVPPLSDEDREFDRFQTIYVYALEEEIIEILRMKRVRKIDYIAAAVIKSFGHLSHKINFIQNLRGKEDFVYKHSLNVAILAAMISHKLNMSNQDAEDCVIAALIHDIGRVSALKRINANQTAIEAEKILDAGQIEGFSLIEELFTSRPGIKRACVQSNRVLNDYNRGEFEPDKIKLVLSTKILLVADTFDNMTAVKSAAEPASELDAVKFLQAHPLIYDKTVVKALIDSINILSPGTSVILSNNRKALVLSANNYDILKPVVLEFASNTIIDLSNLRSAQNLSIMNIMKTLDNRHVIDEQLLKQYSADSISK